MIMNEEEDCDDLPLIKVNSSANDSGSFTMPSAEELASQRARELECERQLQELRERDAERPAALRHSDSSGSESELLAAAATALSLRARPPPAAAPALWAALAPRLPPAARRLPARRLPRLAQALCAAPPAEDVLSCAALLLVVAAAATREAPRAARALHALLDDRATPDQISELVGVVLASFPCPRTRLQLSDALRSGGAGGADRAAAALAGAALLELVGGEAGGGADVARLARAAAAWRAEGAEARVAALALAGRVLAAQAAPPDARERLLAHLAPPPAAGADAQRPDRLKVLVGASKLRLLFCTEQ
ncbi:uncharacterized protein LOC124641685 [Helicoverpa zea]|uniref:uncharacterized protein LOC124641685 n=1 Tax=Helicoverpa zea TaxID=7113 RepID=UPI001F568FE0|nr:uncharacterized protein LOC124641685 [Helicoverpa zea]